MNNPTHLANSLNHLQTDVVEIKNFREIPGLEFLIKWKLPDLPFSWEKFAFIPNHFISEYIQKEKKENRIRAARLTQLLSEHEISLENEIKKPSKIEQIVGVSKNSKHELQFAVLFSGSSVPTIVSHTSMKKNYLSELIHFYESKIVFGNQIKIIDEKS